MTRAGSRFRRVEPRRRARAFALGLLAELPRVNCWTVAGHAGDSSPDGMQHLLARAKRDADGVRDDVRGYVPGHLGRVRSRQRAHRSASCRVVVATSRLGPARCHNHPLGGQDTGANVAGRGTTGLQSPKLPAGLRGYRCQGRQR